MLELVYYRYKMFNSKGHVGTVSCCSLCLRKKNRSKILSSDLYHGGDSNDATCAVVRLHAKTCCCPSISTIVSYL